MTTATLVYGYENSFSHSSISAGVSDPAKHLAALFKRSVQDTFRTATGQNPIISTIPALNESYKEAEIQARFGEQTLPAPAAMREAQELLEALPHWCAVPSPMIEPSGAIAFEWDMGPNRWLVLALKGIGTIEHSAMLGLGNELWGARNFAGALGRHEWTILKDLMQMKD